jgi:hypothetical protein
VLATVALVPYSRNANASVNRPRKKSRGVPTLRVNLLAAFSSMSTDDFAEWCRGQVQVTLNRETTWTLNGFQFGENKIAPLLFVAADVAEEAKVFLIGLALGRKPRRCAAALPPSLFWSS